MLTLKQILSSQSPLLEGKKVKLVRHKDSRAEYRHMMKDRDALLEYQKEQGKDVFKNCDYIISFIGIERRRSVFIGVFKVNGSKPVDDGYHYDLEPIDEFSDLIDRIVIDWGNNAISWHQWYDRHDKEVIEILPKGYVGAFPGLLDFVLEYDELKTLVNNPDANHDWLQHLSAVNGIYLILDNLTGQQYIGSAYGTGGIWQRWCEYAANSHGGNIELKSLVEKDQGYACNFTFSVLQSLPSNITPREIVKIEGLYKDKLGSRAHGLNAN